MLAACRGAAEAAGIDYPRLVYPDLEKEMSLAILIALGELCRLEDLVETQWRRPDMSLIRDPAGPHGVLSSKTMSGPQNGIGLGRWIC